MEQHMGHGRAQTERVAVLSRGIFGRENSAFARRNLSLEMELVATHNERTGVNGD